MSQSGTYKMDCRFNKKNLSKRIENIASIKQNITLSNHDANIFLQEKDAKLPQNSFIYIDPPYFNKGSGLYMNFYKKEEHQAVSNIIKALSHPWILTYDNANTIRELYKECKIIENPIRYSLNSKKQATELLISSHSLQL